VSKRAINLVICPFVIFTQTFDFGGRAGHGGRGSGLWFWGFVYVFLVARALGCLRALPCLVQSSEDYAVVRLRGAQDVFGNTYGVIALHCIAAETVQTSRADARIKKESNEHASFVQGRSTTGRFHSPLRCLRFATH